MYANNSISSYDNGTTVWYNNNAVPKVSFEVIACSKNIAFGSPEGCQQIIPSTANAMPNASACKQVNIAFPIEMNTVSSPNGIVKTIESEKEAFICKVTGNVPQGIW
jgi:hypothetical protein